MGAPSNRFIANDGTARLGDGGFEIAALAVVAQQSRSALKLPERTRLLVKPQRRYLKERAGYSAIYIGPQPCKRLVGQGGVGNVLNRAQPVLDLRWMVVRESLCPKSCTVA